MEQDQSSGCVVPISNAWSHETDRLLHAIDEGLSGNIRQIALLSEYLAGREEIVSKIVCVHPGRTAKITLTSCLNDLSVLADTGDADIIILENCQFLFQRTIGGFHLIDEFIEVISRKDKIWVTTWNIHAWRYLHAVKEIGSIFPVQIQLKQKTEPELMQFILSGQTSSIFYIIDTPVPRRMLVIKKQRKIVIPFFNLKFKISYYSLRMGLIIAILRKKSNEIEPAELIFERLSQISNGNPGIALKIWENSRDAWEIRLSKLTPPSLSRITDPDTAYILSLIITLEDVLISDLTSTVPADINLNQILSKLQNMGLISVVSERIIIKPLALTGITTEMKRIRMVW
jgi:hypothetical protein